MNILTALSRIRLANIQARINRLSTGVFAEVRLHPHKADVVNLCGNNEQQGRFQSEAIEKS
jgi:hypothetical protein